ncbi:cation-transporting P-type ATPase [Nguyenibacter sp. L1]|nr:cation-transporting P-type ATPase [Nguyenibacter sp. L1]WRH86780.1 cation-transporting P-type ATPase [Nguyenibacter sp. L1]
MLAGLGVSADEGLDEDDARGRRAVFGPNRIAARRAVSAPRLLLHQFGGPVACLLGAAAALAFYFGDREAGGAVVAVLAINALIGFVTELKAVRSIEALRALGGRTAHVRRAGRVRAVPAEDLVPGDIVLLDAGDAVSADLRLIEASGLAADESALTGESVATDKNTQPVGPDARLGERVSMLFKGSSVTRGSGVGVVVGTGLATELGRMTQLVLEADAGRSPLERELARLSVQLIWATLAVAAAIAAVGLIGGRDPILMLQSAIALAVAAIPEGLPIVVTLALARGMWRMARQNALIERLSAVETLGATTVILTDKTGTLTENRMTVRRLCMPSGQIEMAADADPAPFRPARDGQAESLLRIAVLCNDAQLDRAGDGGSGDPMEVALLRAGLRAGIGRASVLAGHRLVRKHAFDTMARMMATVHEGREGFLVAVKGAPETVLGACARVIAGQGDVALDETARAEWRDRAGHLGEQGLRVIACAMKTVPRADAAPYDGLVLVGLIGLEDPVRADVPDAIGDCRRAGIRVVMVTGDHAVTARSIGRAAGLSDDAGEAVDGGGIAGLALADPARLRAARIFARVSPSEKLALVRAYQAAGDVVAMTGDGVNDAPALRQADIGVAMGRRGTDVAREAAAMILLDDAFPTIVKAIRQGRIIFGNIRRFVAYLLSCNLSEVIVVGIAVASALPLPVLPLQLLYLNLVTDVFPAFALAMGEGEAGILTRAPRDPKEPILGPAQWVAITLQGGVLAAGTFAALASARWFAFDARQSVTVTFLTLAFGQLWHGFNMRDPRAGVLVNDVTRNGWLWGALVLCGVLLALPPYLGPISHPLHLVPPTATMWAVVLGCSAAPLAVIQAIMTVGRLRGAAGALCRTRKGRRRMG